MSRNFTQRELLIATEVAVVTLVLDRVSLAEDDQLVEKIAEAGVDVAELEAEFLKTTYVLNARSHFVPRGSIRDN